MGGVDWARGGGGLNEKREGGYHRFIILNSLCGIWFF